ncbi:MAG: ATPase, T2SS/T4P/T4SS family [Candidatus Omnitrophota bacterium]
MTKSIVFFSTKGGVGTTTVAFNTAVSVSLQKKKILFISLDLDAPLDVLRMCRCKAKKSLAELIGVEDEIKKDPSLLKENFLTTVNPYLDFLPVVTSVRMISLITAKYVARMLEFFKQLDYDYIVIDGGENLSDVLIKIFDNANLILLVVTPDVLSLYQTKWILDTIQALGFPCTMMKGILNRSQSRGSVRLPDIKLIIPIDIISLIPSDGKTVGFALNRGTPVVLDSPNSKVCTAIEALGIMLMSQEDIYISHKRLSDLRVQQDDVLKKRGDVWSSLGLSTEPEKKVSLKEEKEDAIISLKKRVHDRLIEEMNLKRLSPDTLDINYMRSLKEKTEHLLVNILAKEAKGIISSVEVRRKLIKEIVDEALGLGPLEDLIKDQSISEIMVNNKDQIYIERRGRIEPTTKRFTSNKQIRVIMERILAPLGRRIDESFPYVDARLADGSRVNAIIPPLSLTGPVLTIRKFMRQIFSIYDLTDNFSSLNREMAHFLQACVIGRKNILVSGGTGSGKTTFLNILSEFIPDGERIITIEDSAELRLHHRHWIRLESRPANIEGKGEIAIRDLFRNTLRMRPDRIIVGECRGREILDMLQAMNTGHDGSMSTIHANSTSDVLIRLDSMVLMSGVELPIRAIREMVSSAIDVVVHTSRMSDGSRKVIQVTEIVGMADETHIDLKDIFIFKQEGVDDNGKVIGTFLSSGYIPSFYNELCAQGISLPEDTFTVQKV